MLIGRIPLEFLGGEIAVSEIEADDGVSGECSVDGGSSFHGEGAGGSDTRDGFEGRSRDGPGEDGVGAGDCCGKAGESGDKQRGIERKIALERGSAFHDQCS